MHGIFSNIIPYTEYYTDMFFRFSTIKVVNSNEERGFIHLSKTWFFKKSSVSYRCSLTVGVLINKVGVKE